MTKALFLSLLLTASAPAMADDAFWPYRPLAGASQGGALAPASGTPLTADELDTQLAANQRHQDELRALLIETGGCNGDVLPVWVANACNYNPFGKATEGGDSSSGGDSGSGAE